MRGAHDKAFNASLIRWTHSCGRVTQKSIFCYCTLCIKKGSNRNRVEKRFSFAYLLCDLSWSYQYKYILSFQCGHIIHDVIYVSVWRESKTAWKLVFCWLTDSQHTVTLHTFTRPHKTLCTEKDEKTTLKQDVLCLPPKNVWVEPPPEGRQRPMKSQREKKGQLDLTSTCVV